MNKNKIVPFIEQSLGLISGKFKVLKNAEKQMILYDEVNQIYLDIKHTNQVGNFQTGELFGFGIDVNYETENGLTRHIEMLDTGKMLSDTISFTEGDYTATFTASEKMDVFEIGEKESLLELVSKNTRNVTCAAGYYLAVNPNQNYFDISLKQGEDVIYTEHRAKNSKKSFECNTIKIKYGRKDGQIISGNHVNTTMATEGNCKIYRMTYMGEDEIELNYSSYFVSSVYDNLEGFDEWAPYQFSDIVNPYSILLKDTDIKKEEIISYLTMMKWGKDHIRLTIFKLKDHFVINFRSKSQLNSRRLPVLHPNSIDKEEINRIKEYLETEITDEIFLSIVNQELDKFSSYLESSAEKTSDVVDPFSTENLFNQGMEETKNMICSKNSSVIEQLLKKKNSFELDSSKEKVKQYQ